MTPYAAATLIATTVRDEWTGARVLLPKEDHTPDPAAPHIQLTLRSLPPTATTLGTRSDRMTDQRGVLIALVRYPLSLGDGMGGSLKIAQDFRDLLQGRSIGTDPLHFDHAAPSDLGTDGPWSLASVEIPFRYQERT